jgi:peroxiredoxin
MAAPDPDAPALPAAQPTTDDGAADRLLGQDVPDCALPATDGSWVDLSLLTGRSVVYCHPRIGRPDRALPPGWDQIPGARGCTPQSCAFRDRHADLADLRARVFGLSTQDIEEQREAVECLRLPFPLLSDGAGCFAVAMRLPTFRIDGRTMLRRLTMIVRDGVVEHVRYPVARPEADAAEVIAWLRAHPFPEAAR